MNTLLDMLPLWLALAPLGVYLAGLGVVHLRRRPLVMSGVWDGILLGGSLAGLAAVGPLALVRPAAGTPLWGWLIVLLLFGLLVAVCVLVSRPRLVVYNITVEQLRPLVAEIVAALDPAARWAGEAVALPGRGLQVHIDSNGAMRTVSLVAAGERPSLEAWGEFGRRLRQAVARLRVRPSPWGGVFAAAGGILILVAAAAWAAAAIRSAAREEARDASPTRSVGA